MLPQVQAYFTAIETAKEAYDTAYRKATEDNPVPAWSYNDDDRATREAAYTRLNDAQDKTHKDYDDAIQAARTALAATDDPQLKFLAEVALKQFPSETEIVLRLLPLTREDLERVGPSNRWCPEFARLYNLAEEHNALPPFADPRQDVKITPLVNALKDSTGAMPMELRAIVRQHLLGIRASILSSLDMEPLVETLFTYDHDRDGVRVAIRQHLLDLTGDVPAPTEDNSNHPNW